MKPCTHLSPAVIRYLDLAASWMCISATAKWCSQRRRDITQSRSHRSCSVVSAGLRPPPLSRFAVIGRRFLRGGSLAAALSVSRSSCLGISRCSFSFTASAYRLSSRPLTPSLTQSCFRCSGVERAAAASASSRLRFSGVSWRRCLRGALVMSDSGREAEEGSGGGGGGGSGRGGGGGVVEDGEEEGVEGCAVDDVAAARRPRRGLGRGEGMMRVRPRRSALGRRWMV